LFIENHNFIAVSHNAAIKLIGNSIVPLDKGFSTCGPCTSIHVQINSRPTGNQIIRRSLLLQE